VVRPCNGRTFGLVWTPLAGYEPLQGKDPNGGGASGPDEDFKGALVELEEQRAALRFERLEG
jgi:hypothetical protein